MAETIVLLIFAATLVVSIVFGTPLLLSLFIGFCLFFGYGLARHHGVGSLLRMSAEGLQDVGSVIVLFAIIGALTASWRAAGTIPAITVWSASLVSPENLVIVTFLLCCAMSFITGSSFAAAATTGVICWTIATAMKANGVLVGGAILSGCFFGDRCSPLSSSAALVAKLTHTKVSDNVRRMFLTAAVPFALSVAAYMLLGHDGGGSAMRSEFVGSFQSSFTLGWYVILPAVIVLVLAAFKVDIEKAMLASLACALVLCVGVQHVSVADLPRILVLGYTTSNRAIARMVDGGGIMSMFDIAAIVAMASTYSGLFQGTGLLDGLHDYVNKIARHSTPFISVLVTGLATCCIACDQIVATMLTQQLCDECEHGGSALALDLENSTIILPAIIPWSTSAVGIIAFIGFPMVSVTTAFFIYLIPLWTLALSIYQHAHPAFADGAARIFGLDARDDVRRFADVEGGKRGDGQDGQREPLAA